MTITEQGNSFKIEFKYHPVLVEAVKGLTDRRWDAVDKCWKVPLIHKEEVLAFGTKYHFQLGPTVEPEQVFTLPPMPQLDIHIPLKMEMFPYQKQGVAYALQKRNVIIGDLPGLGKTVQAIATVMASGTFPCLVICPSSLKINWSREWAMWTDKKAIILEDKVRNTWDQYWTAGMVDVFIVNYESLKKFFISRIDDPGKDDKGKKKPLRLNHIHFNSKIDLFKSMVVDESHKIKDIKTQQTKFVKGISKNIGTRLLLTGTPVINKPKDLIAPLGIIEQTHHFGGYNHFVKRYCSGPNEASNLRELGYLLRKHCFYQRAKKEVLEDLPDKKRSVVLCEISNRQEYAEAEADFLQWLIKYKDADTDQLDRAIRGEVMVRINILRNISARGKLESVFDYVDDFLLSGEKLILFAHLKEVVAKVKERYPGCVSVTGSDNQQERQAAVDAFQNNPEVKLIVCSLQAAGVGLTLTASSTVGFIEFPWTAALCDQAEDRAHRIGQKNSVDCIYFQGRNTIDERVYQIIQAKRDISTAVTGTDDQIEENIIENIINLFTKESQPA